MAPAYIAARACACAVEFDGLYRVHSMFLTEQGEGPFSGDAAVFVRLEGCNIQNAFVSQVSKHFNDYGNPQAAPQLDSEQPQQPMMQ